MGFGPPGLPVLVRSVSPSPPRAETEHCFMDCIARTEDTMNDEVVPKGEDGPRVLIVDDDDGILATMARTLANSGCRVEVARDAESARHALRRSFDVLVSDIHLP